ncbi:MAG: hypothetical protein ABIL70_04010 [candidate division WOR-3 bacterium]
MQWGNGIKNTMAQTRGNPGWCEMLKKRSYLCQDESAIMLIPYLGN